MTLGSHPREIEKRMRAHPLGYPYPTYPAAPRLNAELVARYFDNRSRIS
jgi:hypothetical protein